MPTRSGCLDPGSARSSRSRRSRGEDPSDGEEQPFDLFDSGARRTRRSYRSDASPPEPTALQEADERRSRRRPRSPEAITVEDTPSLEQRRVTRRSTPQQPEPKASPENVSSFDCERGCGWEGNNRAEQAQHHRECEHEVGPDGFECERGCGFESERKEIVERHESRCRFKQEFECEQNCGFDHKDKKVVEQHELTCKFGEKAHRHSCTYNCGFSSRKESRVRRHEQRCDLNGNFVCEYECGFEHKNRRTVEEHEQVCTFAVVMYDCEKGCGFGAPNQRTVQRHEALCNFVGVRASKRRRRTAVISDDDDDMEDEDEGGKNRSLRDRSRVQKPERLNMSIMGGEIYTKKNGSRGAGPYSDRYNESAQHRPRDRSRRHRHDRRSDRHGSSSSDSDDFETRERRRRRQWDSKKLSSSTFGDRLGGVHGKEDVSALDIDKSVDWKSIGGLDKHIEALREMVLLPMMYPEVFGKFAVNPPRGVIFYGPPGTGKTMMARALANACASSGEKVAFFMRKGSDCLSKWVGEAERQLRILFEEARRQQPSIIFFDEVDGLAPVRSAKQDQIHSSIVSTLLGLMDGLDKRGKVIVIGATNRIDQIDPALRRPGRFDREFCFQLPDYDARKAIFEVMTQKWTPPLDPSLICEVAQRTNGFCGADLAALCAESSLMALKERYPQVYSSEQKLVIELDSVVVEQRHLVQAMQKVQPAAHRMVGCGHGRPLPLQVRCCLEKELHTVLQNLLKSFNFLSSAAHAAIGSTHLSQTKAPDLDWPGSVQCVKVHRPRLLLEGPVGCGHELLAPAVLHALEGCQVFCLDLATLFADGGSKMLEETVVKQIREARRSAPSILYMPHADRWWTCMGESIQATLCCELQDLPADERVLLLATSEAPFDTLSGGLKQLFRDQIHRISAPSTQALNAFWTQFTTLVNHVVPESRKPTVALPELAVAPSPPAKAVLSPHEAAQQAREEAQVLRELRIVLRDLLAKLSKDVRFRAFCRHDSGEGDDDRKFMDFETMLERLDDGVYRTSKLFLADIQQIRAECKQYCKSRDVETKPALRRSLHRANELVDHADWLIEENVDLHLQARAEEFAKAAGTPVPVIDSATVISAGRASGRLRGISVPDEVFFGNPEELARKQKELEDSLEKAEPCSPAGCEAAEPEETEDGQENAEHVEESEDKVVECPSRVLNELVKILVEKSKDASLERLLEMHHTLKAQLDTDFVTELDREDVGRALKKCISAI